MSSTLGEKLRQAREERGISISEVAEQTRISPLYIESIENDNYKPLPGGIFNKGFVKSYAKYVGYDEQEALQEYSALISSGESSEAAEMRSYRPEVLTDERNAATQLPTLIFAGIILALMTGGVLFLVNYIQNRPDEPDTAANTSTASPAAVTDSPANTEPAPAATDRIDVELRAISEPVWVSYTLDGTKNIKTLAVDESLKVEAKESFALSFSKAKLPNLQIFLNGRQIKPPDSAKGTIEFEINKSNLAQYIQGTETSANQSPAGNPAAPAQSPARQQAAKPRPAADGTPKPAARLASNEGPRSSPTPIVVGRPRVARPSPN